MGVGVGKNFPSTNLLRMSSRFAIQWEQVGKYQLNPDLKQVCQSASTENKHGKAYLSI